jgi:hypothetical protein
MVSDESAVYFITNHFYHEGERPERAVIRKNVEEDRRAISSSAADIEIDGRRVRIKLRGDPAEHGLDEVGRYPPHITWSLDHDHRAGPVSIHHEAGETVPAENLKIEPTGDDIPQFRDEYETVGPGDSIAVPVDAVTRLDDSLQLVWQSPTDGSSSVLIDRSIDRIHDERE